MSFINRNIENLAEYPFDRLRKLLADTKHKSSIIDLSIGQPYHNTPSFVKEIIYKEKDNWNLYPPLKGIQVLQKSYLDWLKRRFQVSSYFDERNILPLSGTREGLFSIAMTVNFEKICIPNPFYQVYLGATLFRDAKKIFLLSNEKNYFLIDLKKLESNLKKGPALVYFCSPSNPQGKIANHLYIESLIKIIRKYNSVLIVDECYIDIYYSKKPVGAIEVCEKLGNKLDNIVIFHSLSKRSNVAGLRSGFVIGDSKIIECYKRLRSYSAPTIPIPIQLASSKLWDDDKHIKANREKYKKKLILANKIFSNYQYYESPEAGFFLWLKVNNAKNFVKRAFQNYSIKIMPGEYLAAGNKKNPGNNYVRIALVHSYEKSKTALQQIAQLLK
jgi:aspartate/methionine/tyrosine aminotransferase